MVSFNLLQHHRSKAQALVFYAFDVLIYRGRSVLDVPLYFRREVLHKIFEDTKAAPIGFASRYDIRYRNLDSGLASKTESFQLKETRVEDGTRYNDIRLTLYKIPGGNMRIQEITDEEFGD